MNLSRQLKGHRPAVVLAGLLFFSLVSLATGTEAGLLHNALKRVVALTAYPFLKGRAMIEDTTDYTVNLFFDYGAVYEENAMLREEIIRLREAVLRKAEVSAENQRLRELLQFEQMDTRLTPVPAKVIESIKGMLTIDRGRFHDIEPFMAVITKDGVVGVVTEVNDLTSKVATIHHRDCNIGAMVKHNRLRAYDGVIHASGSDWNLICTMQYIDVKDDVRVNDLVVTSPESLFPSGYPIGRVSRVIETGTLWKMAEIVPAVDPYRLDEVFVVLRAAPDAEVLAGTVPQETELVAAAPEMPDTRSLQERFAP